MRAMVLCAGLGTRLGALTQVQPKPMLEVAGRPILAHILENLARHGFLEVVINLHYHADTIEGHFGDGRHWGVQITYLREAELLGTAGGVKNAEALLQPGGDPILVHYGDVVTDQDLGAMVGFHKERRALATLLLHQRAMSNSIVRMDSGQRILDLLERPDPEIRARVDSPWVNSGVYLLHPDVLDGIPEGAALDFPRDIFPGLIPGGRVFGFPLTGYRCAIDSPERLEKARLDLAGR